MKKDIMKHPYPYPPPLKSCPKDEDSRKAEMEKKELTLNLFQGGCERRF